MKIAVVIPFYNGEVFLEDCLQSIYKNRGDASVYLIDNSDRHQLLLPTILEKFNSICYQKTKPAIGFGKANNIGAKRALEDQCDRIIILNQDSVLLDNCIENLVIALDSREDIAIVAPQTFHDSNYKVERHFINYYLSQNPDLYKDALFNALKPFYQLNNISGACFAIKAELVREYGLFDETYFMYGEDEDLCRKYNYLGYKVGINPVAHIAHFHANTSGSKEELLQIKIYKYRSRFIYELKDIRNSLFKCALKYLNLNFYDYYTEIIKLKVKFLLFHIYYDMVNLINLRKVLLARKKEKHLCLNNINRKK